MPTRGLKSRDPLARLAEQQGWMSTTAQLRLQTAIAEAINGIGGDRLRRALHGDWLHEPLHAILTDVPVGAWTATIALDATGAISKSDAMDKAADATLLLGLLGAVGAAITGMNDWSEIEKPAARKIGLIHGLLNMGATALFVGSAVARARKARSTGRSLAALGYLVVSASAHLGGSLVYEHGIGVATGPKARTVTENLRG